jgi:predicted GTPase
VAEEANPRNQLKVARVELLYPAAILADGTVLIDTPGVGSTLSHNTEAARQVLPEYDAALFALSVDPPITEVELEYLDAVTAKVTRVFHVLNKVDYLALGQIAHQPGSTDLLCVRAARPRGKRTRQSSRARCERDRQRRGPPRPVPRSREDPVA